MGGLTRRYRGQLALDDVTLDVQGASITGLLGTGRILVGQDAALLDRLIRARPETVYDYKELFNEAAVAEYTRARQGAAEPAT